MFWRRRLCPRGLRGEKKNTKNYSNLAQKALSRGLGVINRGPLYGIIGVANTLLPPGAEGLVHGDPKYGIICCRKQGIICCPKWYHNLAQQALSRGLHAVFEKREKGGGEEKT
jgi:hypothetical protein